MRTRQLVILTLFVLTLATGCAFAGQVSYTVAFSGSGSFTGSFTYDTTNDVFTNFTVNYQSQVLDMLAGVHNANNPQFPPAGPPPCVGYATGGAATFAAFTNPVGCGIFWQHYSNSFDMIASGYSPCPPCYPPPYLQLSEPVPGGGIGVYGPFSATPVPEPCSAGLLLLATWFTRKRAWRRGSA